MIEVIKHGQKKFTATCTNCGCEFTYELSDINASGGVYCPDCSHYVAHQNLGNNNGSLYYPPNCRGIQDMPDITVTVFTTTDANKANTTGTLLGDVYTTEKDLEIQQMFKEQMSKKEAIPCAGSTQDQLKTLGDSYLMEQAKEQLKKDAYHWVSQSTII